jgi:hypothetical protein
MDYFDRTACVSQNGGVDFFPEKEDAKTGETLNTLLWPLFSRKGQVIKN